ncbi:MAG TPA: MBL fold hydrolase [Acholeplasmatales bacterium]|nr:MAG: hypothetical protein A2Y16_05985 [Tenericutes bacterium GWF2_57_13]HAQ55864.1 MBL fold hydrolase [Acholeplasmatales bacterium]
MIVSTLIENTSCDPRLCGEHGLSLFVESGTHRLLFDTGGSDLLIHNATAMGVDLASVDTVVISHGHADHGGGLRAFLELNHTAVVLIHKDAFEPHRSKHPDRWIDVGLDPGLKKHPQVMMTDDFHRMDDGMFLFSGVAGTRYLPSMNQNLYRGDGPLVPDEFRHEQNLVIRDRDAIVLFIGCAHTGVVNIMNHAADRYGIAPTHVIGGFHMSSRSSTVGESPDVIREVAAWLRQTESVFYTGHCTGETAYRIMKKKMGKQLQKISTGTTITIETERNR